MITSDFVWNLKRKGDNNNLYVAVFDLTLAVEHIQ